MFWQAFRMTGAATLQIFILGLIGYILVKKNILGEAGLDILSRLTIEITLPFLIFYQLISQFSFSMYPNWWLYPVLSILITGIGLALAYCFSGAVAGRERKAQFMSLVAFQNSGYLPLVLIAALLPKDKADPMLVFLFLFLLGFNLVMFSFGAYLLTAHKNKKFELGSLFSPPVVAIILGMLMVYFRLNRFIPGAVIKPVQMIGETTLPLAMLVVGGSLAAARITRVDKKAVFLVSALKLVVMPLLGLVLV
ncbi:MAG: AEC family transporter, partial [Candidatus Omnitrophota bacterium]|nr:AEC family transporter [Candidatus Omnitrophota bacterium]